MTFQKLERIVAEHLPDDQLEERAWVGSRSALRVLPFALVTIQNRANGSEFAQLIFRAALCSHMSFQFPALRSAQISVVIGGSIKRVPDSAKKAMSAISSISSTQHALAYPDLRAFSDDGRLATHLAHDILSSCEREFLSCLSGDLNEVKGKKWRSEPSALWRAQKIPSVVETRWTDAQRTLVEESSTTLPRDAVRLWSFWFDWYDSILSGRHLDSRLQLEVAKAEVSNSQSDFDQARFLRDVKRVYDKHQLLEKVNQLKAELAELSADIASDEHRSHNKPPELLEVPQSEVLIARLAEASAELEKAKPNREVLSSLAQGLRDAAYTSARYIGGKTDVFVEAAAKELGSSAAKWVVGGGAVVVIAKALHIVELLNRFAGG